MSEISRRKTRSEAASKAYSMEKQQDLKEQIQDILSPIQDKLANIPTKDDLKDYLCKVEDDIMKKLNEKFTCLEVKIKQLEERVDNSTTNDVTISEFNQRINSIEEKIDQFGDLERRIDESEQYSRRQCLRFLNIKLPPPEEMERCTEIIETILRDLDCGVVIDSVDRAHRIGPVKVRDDGRYQQIIVRFNSFKDRTKVYRARKSLYGKSTIRIRLDLTVHRLKLLVKAQEYVKRHEKCEYIFADINCNLAVRLKDSRNFIFFSTLNELEKKLGK